MSLAVISTLNTEKQVIKVVIGTVISDYIRKDKVIVPDLDTKG